MKNFTVFLGLFVFLAVNALADDSARVLARILAGKGAITAGELAKVESASWDQRVDVLAALLEQKGLLSGKELALVAGDGERTAVAGFEPAVSTPPPAVFTPPVATLPAQPRTEAPAATVTTPPVTAQSKFPVTIYRTVLFNSFFDTAVTNIQDVPLFAAKQNSDALGNEKSFGMTARQTRFGMRYQGPQVGGARLSGQLELDLFGGKAALGNGINMDIPRLRLALGRLDWNHVALVGGQDWSIFAPLNPTSLAEFAIPEMSASGNPWIRTPQLRAEFHSAPTAPTRVLLQVAAVDPNMGDYSTAAFATAGTAGVLSRGGWSQLQVNFTPKWQMNLGYGIDQPRSSDLRVGDRVRNQTYMTNLMYKYTPHITFAWEWRRFLTDFKAQQAANERGDHANLGIAYIF